MTVGASAAELPGDLDVGIHDVVRLLHLAGFRTTDSGDGVSKTPGAEVIPFPHVAIQSTPDELLGAARRALVVLRESGLERGLVIEASFSPIDDSAVVLVMWP